MWMRKILFLELDHRCFAFLTDEWFYTLTNFSYTKRFRCATAGGSIREIVKKF